MDGTIIKNKKYIPMWLQKETRVTVVGAHETNKWRVVEKIGDGSVIVLERKKDFMNGQRTRRQRPKL